MAHIRDYRYPFIAAYGEGPHQCAECGDDVYGPEVVHHLDEDRENHDLSNLAPMHMVCHQRHHHVGIKHTDEVKARIAASMRRAYAEGRHGVTQMAGEHNPFYGRKHTPEARAKMSAAARKRRQQEC